MSPSLPAPRREWLWSLPAFAIILSFLWYRKKRGPQKGDNGSATESEETKDDSVGVDCDEEEEEEEGDDDDDDDEEEEETKKKEEETGAPRVFASDVIKVEEESDEEAVAEGVADAPLPGVKNSTLAEDVIIVRNISSSYCGVDTTSDAKCGGSEDMAKKTNVDATSAVVVEQRQGKKKGGGGGGAVAVAAAGGGNSTTATILEQKLAELDLSATQCNGDAVQVKPLGGEDVAERDSANNSPSEVMLSCPSVSGYSDTHSEGSNDSGKGCSEMLTPSRTPASGNSVSGDIPVTSVYEFEIPQYLVGRLIGAHGSNFHKIKEAANVSLYIKTHPDTKELKICAIEGTQMDIDTALDMIRRKFPKKLFPDLTFEQVVISPEPLMIPLYPGNYQLYLVEGINNDVILSSLVSAGHFFLQQPTHPTFPALSRLDSCMTYCYSQPNQPHIPEGIGAGALCAATVYDAWYRAQIVDMDERNEFCTVKFVDYGGYMTMSVSSLRQIRADFINLPFQASECYLADIKPANDADDWSLEAKEAVEKLTFGNILQAQVHGYALHGVPLIYLYSVFNNEFILINEELVNRGYAEWISCENATEDVQVANAEAEAEEEEEDEGAVGFSEIVEGESVA